MKNLIYPTRYGKWDEDIKQINLTYLNKSKHVFDLIIIGTPPDTHSKIYEFCKKKIKYKKILIEKPIFHIKEKKINKLRKDFNSKLIFCGYNHSVSPSYIYFSNIIFDKIKIINKINIKWCESWKGILGAHFWLKNEFESYLGNFKKGGGSLQEHSHGLHLLCLLLKKRKISLEHSNSFFNFFLHGKKKKYDISSSVEGYSKGIFYSYNTDLITFPAEKKISIYSPFKKYEWICNYKKNLDTIKIYKKNILIFRKNFKKTRSSEFENEIAHIMKISNIRDKKKSNLSTHHAIDVIEFIKKAFKK